MGVGVDPDASTGMGVEERAQLSGEPAPRVHGTLTSRLHAILARADPDESFEDLERALNEVLDDVTVKTSAATRGQAILADPLYTQASTLMAQLDQQRTREIIAGLHEVIAGREEQGDYWPEGRLNLGIAYAVLGEYTDAERWLDEAVDMFRRPSNIGRSKFMAA